MDAAGEGAIPAWHQALVVALTGERRTGLGRQVEPQLEVVARELRGRPLGAYAVPADLLVGIGPARFAAVLTELRAQLSSQTGQPVLADRAPDADERRLLADVPPHH